MSRRFLTAEDVRRSQSREIVVEEGTVVTPQALEVARQSGIEVRTSTGAYTPPAPDRGPDAERLRDHPLRLPEPDSGSDGTHLVVTAVGQNRAGVLAELTGVLGQWGVSVHDISQRVVEGYFHLFMVVELPAQHSFDELKTALQCLGGPEDYAVRVMHERVFTYMHRV